MEQQQLLHGMVVEKVDNNPSLLFHPLGEYPSPKPSTTLHTLSQVLSKVLEKMSQEPSSSFKRSISYQAQYQFHIKRNGQFFYSVITTVDGKIRTAFQFLEDVEANHLRKSASNLRTILKEKLAYYNNIKNDKITATKLQIEDIKGVMVENIDKVLERGERLDSLITKTDDLVDSSFTFRKGTKRLKRKVIIQIIILIVGIVVAVVVLFLILFLIVFIGFCYGLPGDTACKKK